MEAPIWDKINIWVIIQGDFLTVDKMFAEVENYMNIPQHKTNVKKKLTTINMKQDKTISDFLPSNFCPMDHGWHTKWGSDQDISIIAIAVDLQSAVNEIVYRL